MITRSIELFGSPWSARWVANLKVGVDTRETVVGRTSDFLCALPWHHALVEPLTEAAWAEHLLAMQNPRLRYGPDDSQYRYEGQEQARQKPAMALGHTCSSGSRPKLELIRRTGHLVYS
ncbi:unnamed protein product [Rhizoctonia solani]|uniref:Uncharacterized protein n=1 Tax=Rhizoctonia solani TaxID=456999 RepID=A0A8H3DDN3_9AGAM|nr:unnamed protein product [Rhizoctonia solani]